MRKALATNTETAALFDHFVSKKKEPAIHRLFLRKITGLIVLENLPGEGRTARAIVDRRVACP